MIADDWISDSMPKTRAIATALMILTVDYLSVARGEMKAKTGSSAAEVFVQSISTDESYEQSRTRLVHAARGFQVVKPKGR